MQMFSTSLDTGEEEHSITESNEAALVTQIEIEGRIFLFPGDIGEETEQNLKDVWLDVDVLKVAHHGSKYSTSSDFLTRVQPEVAVISCGRKNRYGHPHEETLERLEENNVECYITAEEGALRVREKQGQLICESYENMQ